VLSAAVAVAHAPGRHATAWHWFHDSARLLVGDPAVDGAGGLALYRDHPEFQFGPLSTAVSVPFSLFGLRVGSWLAIAVGSALGLVAVTAVAAAALRLRPDAVGPARTRSLVTGAVVFVVVWGAVAVRTAHLDDAVALTATALAVWALTDRRPWWAAVLLGLAAAAKPWAVVFILLLLIAPGRFRLLRPVVAGALALITWAPFVIAEPATLDVRDFRIANEATSALRALGFTGEFAPDWVRPAQLLGGLALVGFLVLVGRWPAALMAGVAVRLVLDPAANRYYTAGLVLAVLVFEWVEFPERLPWLAAGSALLLEASQLSGMPSALGGWMRVVVVAAVLATAVLWRPTQRAAAASIGDAGSRPAERARSSGGAAAAT
jgi:hypothetical protein